MVETLYKQNTLYRKMKIILICAQMKLPGGFNVRKISEFWKL